MFPNLCWHHIYGCLISELGYIDRGNKREWVEKIRLHKRIVTGNSSIATVVQIVYFLCKWFLYFLTENWNIYKQISLGCPIEDNSISNLSCQFYYYCELSLFRLSE